MKGATLNCRSDWINLRYVSKAINRAYDGPVLKRGFGSVMNEGFRCSQSTGKAMNKIGQTWFPVSTGSDSGKSSVQAIEWINMTVESTGVRVINIETVYEFKWRRLSLVAVGFRVWHESK